MSISIGNSVGVFSPIPMTDVYLIGAGQIKDVTVQVDDNSGLLGNDQEVAGGVVGGLTLSVTGIGSSPDAISSTLSLTSGYGEWTVQPNGAFTYTANGLASKKLLEGQVATDFLYYQEINIFQKTAIGQAQMNIIGAYDPMVARNTGTYSYHLSEDEWKVLIDQGANHFSIPHVHIDYVDNPADLRATVDFVIQVNRPDMQNLFSAELNNLAAQIHPTFYQASDESGVYFAPDFEITKADLDFLRPGDQITIAMNFAVSDGRTSEVFTSNIIIDGVYHPLEVAPDTAEVTQNRSISREASVSVLNNDFDPDFLGELKVFSVESNVTPWTLILGGNRGPINGEYGSLHMFGDGSYEYIPYSENRYLLQTVTDHFAYEAMNDVNKSRDSTLDIEIKPYPGVVAVSSDINQSVELDEQLNLLDVEGSVEEQNGYSYTILGNVIADSVRDIHPGFVVDYVSDYFAPSNYSPLFRIIAAGAINNTSVEIIGFNQLDAEEGLWRASFPVAFLVDQRFGFKDFSFMNAGDRITVTYEIHGDQGRSVQEGNDVFDMVYDKSILLQVSILGRNDAPVTSADNNFVFMGQTIQVSGGFLGEGLLSNDYDVDLEDEIFVVGVMGEHAGTLVSMDAPGVVQGAYGWLTVYHDGSYSYQADQNSLEPVTDSGVGLGRLDTFLYAVADTHGGITTEFLSITVFDQDDKPVTVDDEFFIALDEWDPTEPLLNILANDLDYDTSRLRVAMVDSLPDQYLLLDEHGNISLNFEEFKSLGSGQWTTLYFAYTATNGIAESDITGVVLHVRGSDEAPVSSDDDYFYENIAGSVFEVSQPDGLILHENIVDRKSDNDIDGDSLVIRAVSVDINTWVNLTDGSASLQLDGNVSVLVHSNGSFVMDTPDDYRGMVSFSYLLSDGYHTATGSATVEVGGPAPQQGQLLINEISLDNPLLVRNAYTDNGSAPNRIKVGKASIELLNDSTQPITTAQLAKMKIEIIGADGSAVTSIDLRHLTGLTEDASGNALSKFFIPAGGVLMLYEPGSLGLGTWALYGPDKSFIIGGSGSYAGQDWPLGSVTKDAIAINLVQNGTSIDLFAANGADISALTGVIGLGENGQDEGSEPGVPWVGTDIGTNAGVQYDGSISDLTDTLFARTSLEDTNSEADWGNFGRLAMTIGDVNDRSDFHIQNPDDPLDNMDPNQGVAGAAGQIKSVVSGSDSGDGGPDVLVGQSGNDTLNGGGGDDLQIGGGGADSIDGGTGGDNIHGGEGADLLRGGTGNDVFVYEAISDSTQLDTDVILDFENSRDKIDLSLIDADAAKPGDQAFLWGGAVAGRPAAGSAEGKIVYWTQNGLTFIQADATGDGLPPLELMLSGTHTMGPADFIL